MVKPLKTFDIDFDIKKQINQKLDSNIIKTKPNDTNEYIAGNTCIDILNNIFGHVWSWDIEKEWVEPGVDYFKKDTDYYKAPDSIASFNNEGKRGVLLKQNPTMWVKGVLTVYFYDEDIKNIIEIRKTAFGSTPIAGPQQTQAKNGFKGAQTDALKKAASLLGIATELYRDQKEKKWFDNYFKQNLPITLDEEAKAKYKEILYKIDNLINNYSDPQAACEYYVNVVTKGYTNDLNKIPLDKIEELFEILNNDYLKHTKEKEG